MSIKRLLHKRAIKRAEALAVRAAGRGLLASVEVADGEVVVNVCSSLRVAHPDLNSEAMVGRTVSVPVRALDEINTALQREFGSAVI